MATMSRELKAKQKARRDAVTMLDEQTGQQIDPATVRREHMTVKKLRAALAKYPDKTLVVIRDAYSDEPCNLRDGLAILDDPTFHDGDGRFIVIEGSFS